MRKTCSYKFSYKLFENISNFPRVNFFRCYNISLQLTIMYSTLKKTKKLHEHAKTKKNTHRFLAQTMTLILITFRNKIIYIVFYVCILFDTRFIYLII